MTTRHLIGNASDIKEKKRVIANVKGMELGIFYVDGEFYAYRNLCPHAAAPVCEGPVCGTYLLSDVYQYQYGKDSEVVRCPWHGWEFDLKSGEHLADPSTKLRGYPVVVENDQVYVVPSTGVKS
ncbi:2Fe-2S ferredoxin [Paenibacillus swuensis]|uniref:2Fe-2S ferredoxin n=1 Tax=Paenibacillus swuensis TaxID=1178515 RepID=A0A172TFX0_9BACL|nr:Rieske (2Fe-2S) protein [Paenibacillus swuensis]ANE45683.1 2Fe-2S ferredoxin [Paenibacillus swuensis]